MPDVLGSELRLRETQPVRSSRRAIARRKLMPHVSLLGIERQRLERDRDLRDPASLVDRRGRVPDAFPVPLLLADVLEQPLLAQAVRIRHEAIAAAPIVERVEQHREPVVAEYLFALAENPGRDLARVADRRAARRCRSRRSRTSNRRPCARWPARTRSAGSRAGRRAGTASCQASSSSTPSMTGGVAVRTIRTDFVAGTVGERFLRRRLAGHEPRAAMAVKVRRARATVDPTNSDAGGNPRPQWRARERTERAGRMIAMGRRGTAVIES